MFKASHNYLSGFAADSDFASKMAIAFGDGIDLSELNAAKLSANQAWRL